MRRMLVVSPPTLDYISVGGSIVKKPGGPALYASFGASMVGWRVYAVGPWGWETMESAAAERDVGVDRIGYQFAGRGAVFRHLYIGGRRVSEVLGRPEAIRYDEVARAVNEVKPDAVIISPVTGEEAGSVAAALTSSSGTPCLAIDVQGYVRGFRDLWDTLVPPSVNTLFHVSSDDSEESSILRWARGRRLVAYTRGEGPVTLIYSGLVTQLPGPRKLVTDPTGAGDIFTAIMLTRLCEGSSPEDAALEALKLTPEALEEARRILG